MKRRDFLTLAAASAVLTQARPLRVIGAQLYTVRGILPKEPLETLRAIEKIGYREVEVTFDNMDLIWPSLKQTSLKPVSLHLPTAVFMKEQGKIPATLEKAKEHGFEYVVCPYIAPENRGGADVMQKLAAVLNRTGDLARKAGLHLCYHNHAFEFEPSGDGTLLDVLMKATDPKLVGLEMDIMWVKVGGGDPVSLLQKYRNRVPLMHLKNVVEGTEKRYKEDIPRTAFREVGKGMIEILPVLKAAEKAGVKHYFVEQDQTPGDPLESLRESFEYVSKLNV
ncbi:MAG: sugar phosphate isomerase/epimerase [Bryobacteraceae bacterium]